MANANSEKSKICFQLLDAYSLFDHATHYRFGGAEVRAATFIGHLKKIRSVAVITRDYGQPHSQVLEGVKVLSHPYHTAKPRGRASQLFSRIRSLRLSGKSYEEYLKFGVYDEAGADIYCAFEMTRATNILADYCKQRGKRFCLFIASDEELTFNEQTGTNRLNYLASVSRAIIDKSDTIFVQNKKQLRALQDLFGREGILINSPVDLDNNPSPAKKLYDFLWIGKSNLVKRPEYFVDLAISMPQQKFVMVMNISDKSLHSKMLEKAPANLVIHEQVTLTEASNLMQRSKIFVSTSAFEGFPNTFLQAGKYGVPVLSMNVDPNNFIADFQCGLVCGDSGTALLQAAELMISNEAKTRQFGENIKQYILNNHEAEKVTQVLLRHL